MIPVLLIHLLFYKTSIPNEKKLVAVLVSIGVGVFTYGGSSSRKTNNIDNTNGKMFLSDSLYGFALLAASLFLDGMTNATQDTMLKISRNRKHENDKKNKVITGSHLMFVLNMFIILWNIIYFILFDKTQIVSALKMLYSDPEIVSYLLTYSICGALGQCFIFYTLEQYGSLVLVMITVTRKMISMILSIIVYGKTLNALQWTGIVIVFSGITWEAANKREQPVVTTTDKQEKKLWTQSN
ncbi:UDP-galactose transporter HUT1 NDAI_0F01280 [Naumovozyma dairenensis CBS 421]|uniref:UDP-galactose transporter homolog 1 n=1 Tax=Naumovozyma dairenensis (strain ATCC 10597 / BCRC 20456 / CBS 421 / NBRC 0211 / NRRL Y-12639) TaxID=1071378 RepID=G0WCD6_NAUDC|nr:hypothetical protein NDAI_0F01280 [Naumovozyma dairenensis CBS 421]CCD25447.1 hypothetical protein NDAI_0F01280 [Naumovozyma dairenensis CBS 421]